MIFTTAGHIDHGKTLLVKVLTGTDTDRLPQEKARGISIDIGFAYLTIPGVGLLAFVDVPGHERFVRNMLAGVSGADRAILVVAADDGVMPQTREHLNILNLLGIHRGVVVITKIDRVPEDRVGIVTSEVSSLVIATLGLPWPVIPVCAPTGEGLLHLRDWLQNEALNVSQVVPDSQRFRFSVDRVFTVAGIGTVATGTVFNGVVSLRERVVASGTGNEQRIRGIQIHGVAVERAIVGQRCAINISGADAQQIARGDWLLDSALFHPSARLDVRVAVLSDEHCALKHWTPIHVHLGTTEVTGRIALRGGKSIEPGTSAFAQLALDKPICALHADRFILRDQSATRTIAGGKVIDPFADPLRRRDSIHEQRLAALELEDLPSKLSALAKVSPQGVDLLQLSTSLNLSSLAMEILAENCSLAMLGQQTRFAFDAGRARDLMTAVVNALSLSAVNRKGLGQPVELLRSSLCPAMPAEPFLGLLRQMADQDRVELRAGLLYLPGARPTLNPQDEVLWQIIEHTLLKQCFNPMTPHHIALELGIEEKLLCEVLARRQRSGELVKVADRFYLRATLCDLALIAKEVARQQPDGLFTSAQFRDASSGSRRAAIKVLEFFDTFGVTRRSGDMRQIGRSFTTLLASKPVIEESSTSLEKCT